MCGGGITAPSRRPTTTSSSGSHSLCELTGHVSGAPSAKGSLTTVSSWCGLAGDAPRGGGRVPDRAKSDVMSGEDAQADQGPGQLTDAVEKPSGQARGGRKAEQREGEHLGALLGAGSQRNEKEQIVERDREDLDGQRALEGRRQAKKPQDQVALDDAEGPAEGEARRREHELETPVRPDAADRAVEPLQGLI